LFHVLALLCAEALFAAAESFGKVRGKNVQEIGLVPVENTNVIAGFEAQQWCCGKHWKSSPRPKLPLILAEVMPSVTGESPHYYQTLQPLSGSGRIARQGAQVVAFSRMGYSVCLPCGDAPEAFLLRILHDPDPFRH
jgi:hypothetical protein